MKYVSIKQIRILRSLIEASELETRKLSVIGLHWSVLGNEPGIMPCKKCIFLASNNIMRINQITIFEANI